MADVEMTVCIVIFESGSLICGLAPNINVLIFGRAIQGKLTATSLKTVF